MSKGKRLYCWTIYIARRAEQTEESHHEHVSNVNTPLTIPYMKKHGIVRYSVKHRDNNARAVEESVLKGLPEEQKMAFDCVFDVYFDNVENIESLQKDPDFFAKVLPDHGNFASMPECKGSVTWVEEFPLNEL